MNYKVGDRVIHSREGLSTITNTTVIADNEYFVVVPDKGDHGNIYVLKSRTENIIRPIMSYDEAKKEIVVDRSGMKLTFNEEEGFSRTRPLEAGLNHLRIFVDASSIEIFVNDGDAVFTSRVFPTEEEHHFRIWGDVFPRLWTLKRAIRDHFLI